MTRRENIRLRLLSYGVIAYMLLAFAWWSVLLYTKNRDAFEAKRDLLRIMLVAEGIVDNEAAFYAHDRYQELEKQYQRQEYMILGEAIVFVISLVIGVWLINRGYNKEMLAAQQRRNFLLSITHELKSPIASIRLILETFQKRELTREQKGKMGKNALLETERLNTLVNDLLLSAKLETAYQIYRERIDIRELVDEIMSRIASKYPHVHFDLIAGESLKPLYGDKLGLTSVTINLLENAVKYAADDPEISIRLKNLKNSILWEVVDNGIGIEDKEKKRIFEKFYRVGSEDTRKTKGTGLGLFIVDQIIKAHDGQIMVLDNKPRGTIFSIKLPTDRKPN